MLQTKIFFFKSTTKPRKPRNRNPGETESDDHLHVNLVHVFILCAYLSGILFSNLVVPDIATTRYLQENRNAKIKAMTQIGSFRADRKISADGEGGRTKFLRL